MRGLSILCGVHGTRHYPSFRAGRALAAGFLLIVTCASAKAEGAPASPFLTQGQAVERELAKGGTDEYRVRCRPGDFVHATVEQRGLDVEAVVVAPDGHELLRIDTPTDRAGAETVAFVAAAAGDHRLQVRALDGDEHATYRIELAEQRPATEDNRQISEAWRLWSEGARLRAQATADALAKSLEAYERASQVFAQLGDREDAAMAANRAGQLAAYRDETARSVANYRRALDLTSADTPNRMRAAAYLGLGAGEPENAVAHFQEALSLFRSLGDRRGEAVALHGLAGARNSQTGDSAGALVLFEQALKISRATGFSRLERGTLHEIAALYRGRDERQKALAYYERALELSRAASDARDTASTLEDIGNLYHRWGAIDRAIDLYDEALALESRIGSRLRRAALLADKGYAQLDAGKTDLAIATLTRAVDTSRETTDEEMQASALSILGEARVRRGDVAQGIDDLEAALALAHRSPHWYWPLPTLLRLGEAYSRRGDDARAEKAWTEARDIAVASDSPLFEAMVLRGLARLALRRHDAAAALPLAEAAVAKVESQRAAIARADLKTTFLASVHDYYETHIEALMERHAQEPARGFDARALQASESARARRILEALASSASDVPGGDPVLVERARALRHDLSALAGRHTELLQAGAPPTRRQAIERKLREVESEREEVLGRLRQQGAPRPDVAPPVLSAADIQRALLEPGTTLLEYALGEERSYVWAVTSATLVARPLPAAAVVEERARKLYDALSARARQIRAGTREQAALARADRDAAALSAELARLLLPETLHDWGTTRVVIVADGALQTVPFAGLPYPTAARGRARQPLASVFDVVYAPSASWVATMRRVRKGSSPPPKTVAILADPVFAPDDSRLEGRAEPGAEPDPTLGQALREVSAEGRLRELPRLPFSRREAMAAAALVPAKEALVALDFEASRDRALSPDLSDYRIIHFATHSLLNDEHPELSGVILSLVDRSGRPRDGFVRLQDVYEMKLPAEVVVLSACQTALGRPVAGEGLLGLARGFLYAGSRRVIASLWPVDDAATAYLMQAFYRGVLQRGQSPAAALRHAQTSVAAIAKWRAPYYWAGFVVEGDWP
jgi:CHAT domain-containing protein